MAQPPKYERTKDFTVDYGQNTDHRALNKEFDGAAQSVNAIRANLAKIQRDDGALKNGIVTLDSMAPSALTAIAAAAKAALDPLVASAQGSADAANTAAIAAAASAGLADVSADSAAASATASSTSAGAANGYATDAANTLIAQRNLYYGALAADPTVRPDGSPVMAGDRYLNTISSAEKVYSGGMWVIPNVGAADLSNTTDAGKGASLVGFLQTGAGAVGRGLADRLRERISVFDFMSLGQIADVRARTRLLDVTAAVTAAITEAALRRCDLIFPRGDYLLAGGVSYGYVLAMKSYVRYIGEGTDASVLCLPSSGVNPPTILGGTTYARSVRVLGLGFDGGRGDQSGIVPGQAGAGGAGAGQYEFSHGITQLQGDDIRVEDCAFRNFQGDGVGFGNSYAFGSYAPGSIAVMTDLAITRCRFDNILREAAFFIQCNGAEFSHSHVTGRPYVAGVDVERHHVSDMVKNINIFRNRFDFDVYRRAVSCLVSDLTYLAEDENSRNIFVDHNTVRNGQVDVRSFTGVRIRFNDFDNAAVDVPINAWISRSAIYIDPTSGTSAPINTFGGHEVIGNQIRHRTTLSGTGGYGVYADRNRAVRMSLNAIRDAQRGGIFMRNARDMHASNNNIIDVGTPASTAVGIRANDVCDAAVISSNIIRDTRAGAARGMTYGVSLSGFNNGSPPLISANQIHNMLTADVQEEATQLNFSVYSGNVTDGVANTPGAGRVLTGSVAGWSPGSIGNTGTRTQTVTVTGAGFGMPASAAVSADLGGLVLDAWVSSANTVTVRLTNNTGAAVNPGTLTAKVIVQRLS